MDRLVARIMQDFSLDLYEPIYPRALDLGTPLLPRAGNLVSVVVGMRRSGKTYRLFQEMRRLLDDGVPPAQMLYFNFEDDRLKPLTSAVGDAVLDTFFELHPEAHERGAYLFLDEVQEIEDWGTWLRRIIDTKKVTVYATGSSSKLLSADVATAFRGRSVEYELLPMSFGEFVRCHEPEVFGRGSLDGGPMSSVQEDYARQLFKRYLVRGGFPGVQDQDDARAVMVLQSYAQRAVAQDVIERHNMGNPQMVSLFAQRALATSGRELSLRKVENDMRSAGLVTSRAALSDALRYFEDAFLGGTVKRFSRALADSARSPVKVYAIDPGLAYANSSAPSEDVGQRLEDVVYLELRRRHAQRRTGAIASLKTVKSGFEVDFIVGDALSQKGSALYQVSVDASAPKTYDRETRALREAMGERAVVEAYLLTLDGEERDVRVAEGVIREMPVWKWCLQQDQDR